MSQASSAVLQDSNAEAYLITYYIDHCFTEMYLTSPINQNTLNLKFSLINYSCKFFLINFHSWLTSVYSIPCLTPPLSKFISVSRRLEL